MNGDFHDLTLGSNILWFISIGDPCKQCDQMAVLFFQHLSICYYKNVSNSIEKSPKKVQHFAQILRKLATNSQRLYRRNSRSLIRLM